MLGGGIVPGSLILIGGDPGYWEINSSYASVRFIIQYGHRVLYISGEESVKQTKLRATRLGVESNELYFYAETDLELIRHTIEEVKPEICHCRLHSNDSSSGSNECSR